MQETNNLKLKKPEHNEYADIADINYNMDLIDEEMYKKLDKDSKAKDSDKIDGLDSSELMRLMLTYDNQTSSTISKEIFNNAAYKSAYVGDINFGAEVGLLVSHNKIIYLPHKSLGYGTQIAIPFEGGNFTTMYIRNAVGNTWGAWNDMRSMGNAENNEYRRTYDANTAIESGKLYFCMHNQCQNLPRGTVDDGILISFMHRTDVKYGFQLYMTWNNDELWTRNIIGNNFQHWKCISGGKWSFHKVNDNTTVGHYLRWQAHEQNHVIFDASKGIRPDGQVCSNYNAEVGWAATYPNLMGFNGINTYGLRVDSARWADSASGVMGFQFRNNNGQLEILIGGAWLSVGAKQYTVVRQGVLNESNQSFSYSGGAGIVRLLGCRLPHLTQIIVDGNVISSIYEIYVNTYHGGHGYHLFNIEFKNSIEIKNLNGNNTSYFIQTEK